MERCKTTRKLELIRDDRTTASVDKYIDATRHGQSQKDKGQFSNRRTGHECFGYTMELTKKRLPGGKFGFNQSPGGSGQSGKV